MPGFVADFTAARADISTIAERYGQTWDVGWTLAENYKALGHSESQHERLKQAVRATGNEIRQNWELQTIAEEEKHSVGMRMRV